MGMMPYQKISFVAVIGEVKQQPRCISTLISTKTLGLPIQTFLETKSGILYDRIFAVGHNNWIKNVSEIFQWIYTTVLESYSHLLERQRKKQWDNKGVMISMWRTKNVLRRALVKGVSQSGFAVPQKCVKPVLRQKNSYSCAKRGPIQYWRLLQNIFHLSPHRYVRALWRY